MDSGEFLGLFLVGLFWIACLTLTGFFLYWTARILIILPKCILRITTALEKIADKK